MTWLFIHDWLDIPNGYEWNTIKIESSQWYSISYSLDTYLLLSKPYPTDCIDYYIKTKFLSQKDCVRKCKIRESIDKCNAIPNQTNLFEWEIRRFYGKYSVDNCSQNLDLNKKCNYFCQNMDCVKTYFTPRVVASGQIAINSNMTIVEISIPMEPNKIYCYLPKIETIEFFCYLASILSLWFGFSFLSIHILVEKLQKWFENKFKLKFRFNYVENNTFSRRYENRF